jgi:hypothetical protein
MTAALGTTKGWSSRHSNFLRRSDESRALGMCASEYSECQMFGSHSSSPGRPSATGFARWAALRATRKPRCGPWNSGSPRCRIPDRQRGTTSW